MKPLRVFLFVVAAFASGSLFAETEIVGDIEWTYWVNDGKAEISSISPHFMSGAITIPTALGGRRVTSIGDSAFYGCSRIEPEDGLIWAEQSP